MNEKKHIYGKLFYSKEYGEDAILLREALYEIAEHLGNTWENPISISLLCLQLMMPYDVCVSISVDITQLLKEKNAQELELSQIKEIMVKHFPEANEFSELTVRGFTKAMAKSWLVELRPFADSLS